MKRSITILLTFIITIPIAVSISGCSKANTIPTVNGSINGIPATTLYGTTGQPTDYIFIVTGTTTAQRNMSYNGGTYPYYETAGNNITITVSPTSVVKGTLDTIASKVVLTITTAPIIFSSTTYSSR